MVELVGGGSVINGDTPSSFPVSSLLPGRHKWSAGHVSYYSASGRRLFSVIGHVTGMAAVHWPAVHGVMAAPSADRRSGAPTVWLGVRAASAQDTHEVLYNVLTTWYHDPILARTIQYQSSVATIPHNNGVGWAWPLNVYCGPAVRV